jgi:hypothetical protein
MENEINGAQTQHCVEHVYALQYWQTTNGVLDEAVRICIICKHESELHKEP